MLLGKTPFSNPNRKQMLKDILRKSVDIKVVFLKNVYDDSEEAKSILTKLLYVNPRMRLGSSVRDADEIKSEPFFRNINWKD
jgi:serine/threonine protein kinase